MNGDDELLAIRAAELYFQDDKNQSEIAARLGVTRWKVGRLLAQAKERGFVRIEIVHPKARRLPLERELQELYGLTDAIVVPSSNNDAETRIRVAEAAADYLATLRPRVRTLGVSWGRTLQQVADALPDGWADGVDVVQVNGGVTVNRRVGMASMTATTFASKGRGTVTLLPSPAILEQAATREAIESDRFVSTILDKAREASTVVFSAGPVDTKSVLVSSGYLTADDVRTLERKGAVGDVLGRYIDADGHIVDPALDARTLGLELDTLSSARTAVAVISGREKWPVCHAVVDNKFCSVLVTDDECANYLREARKR